MSEFQILKSNFATTRIIDTEPEGVAEGEVLLTVDSFSFTANNITYAVMGDQLRYWQFFPPHGEDANGWGIIPVWGFATVLLSNTNTIPVGERVFGYFPPASTLKMKPVHVSETTFIDGAAHRAELPAGYNLYRRVSAEPNYDVSMDQERMLLYPLLVTAFCLHDMLSDNNWFGAEQIVIASASSKTSIGLAYALDEDDNAPKIIGLTSNRNLESVKQLRLYESTATYDKLSAIDADKPTVIVDMSANGEMLGRLHRHLGDNMRFCSNVGLTHWDQATPGEGFIRDRSEMFFAPGHIQKRIKEWGAERFHSQSSAFIQRTALKSRSWLKMTKLNGLEGLAEVYDDVCHGRIKPEQGLIILNSSVES